MGRKREAISMGFGILAGLALSGPAAQAVTTITATLSNQPIYVDGQRVSMTAYSIGGNNHIRLRDFGKAVDFAVDYDENTNSVHINSALPYQEEAISPVPAKPDPNDLEEEAIHAALMGLRDVYPTNTSYGAPYIPNNPLDRPYSNCDAYAGWAMKCSDTIFGTLPWRRVMSPRWWLEQQSEYSLRTRYPQ